MDCKFSGSSEKKESEKKDLDQIRGEGLQYKEYNPKPFRAIKWTKPCKWMLCF